MSTATINPTMNPAAEAPIRTLAAYARTTGSLDAAMLLTSALERQRRAGDQPFSWSWDEIERETSLTRYRQLGARQILERLGLLTLLASGPANSPYLLWRADPVRSAAITGNPAC